MAERIRVGIVGVGNCASSLIQGVSYYSKENTSPIGLMHNELGGYGVSDIEFVVAFDIDERKVGRRLEEAIFAEPNCTMVFEKQISGARVKVRMGKILDGFSEHMKSCKRERTFLVSPVPEPVADDVVKALRGSGCEILLNYLPVGSEQATRFYAECALEAGCAFINNIPVFIAKDRGWADKFQAAGLPLIGDDVKSQLGATIVHRTLTALFAARGVKIDRTYQFNMGGNTDFLNMLNRDRLVSKKISKTESVQSMASERIPADDIHIGPSDHVPWLKDNKICFIRIEGRTFGDVPINLELRLSVEDSPNSAGVVIDAIRCAKLALDRGMGGVIEPACAYFMKSPPRQIPDFEAAGQLEKFIQGK